jgi:hypothetical protein
MGSQTFTVSVDQVFFDFQRSATGEHDNDWLDLIVHVYDGQGKYQYQRSVSAYQLSDLIKSGDMVEALQPPIMIDELTLNDNDSLFIHCSIINRGPSAKLHDALITSAKLIATLGAITTFLGTINEVVIAIKEGSAEGAIAGAVAFIADELLNPHDCHGFVFQGDYTPSVQALLANTNSITGSKFTFPLEPPYTEPNSKGCGHDPVTRVALSVTLTREDPDFGALPPGSVGFPGPPVKIKSLSAAPGSAWGGRWEDAKSRIFCNITVTAPSVPRAGTDGTTAVLNAAASSVTLPLLLTHLGTDPRNPPRDVVRSSGPTNEVGATSGVVFETPPSAFTGAAGLAGGLTGGGAGSLSTSEDTVLAAIWRFSVNVTEVIPSFGGSRNVATEDDLAVAVPMVVVPRIGDHYASLLTKEAGLLKGALLGDAPELVSSKVGLLEGVVFGDASGPVTGATGLASGLASGEGAGSTNQIAPALTPPELGATIPVSDNVFLQLYAGYDARGRFIDYQIRYLRTEGGTVVSDVMLTRQEVLG